MIKYVGDQTFSQSLNQALEQQKDLTNWPLFSLLYKYKKETAIQSFTTLRALDYLPHVKFLPHQVKAAERVIHDMHGRAILADEVGLGKTIQAGLILKEYLLRRLVKRALILVPSSLINQWVKELYEKFYIQVTPYRKNYRWEDQALMIASIDLAKRSPHKEEILKLDYDLLIVDEAHRLKNKETLNHRFIRSIKKKYCLLLTATPIQNDIMELFNLVSIIKPGLLGDYDSFKKNYVKKNISEKVIQQLIQRVMIRNRRKDTVVDTVERKIETLWLSFSEEEQRCYDALAQTLQKTPALSSMVYLKELCSSREACYLSLQKSNNKALQEKLPQLLSKIEALPHHQKAIKLVEKIKEIGSEKIIVFTQYRATQYYLQWFLQTHNIPALSFYGGLKRGRKEWITQLFKDHYQVLIATEAGGEGINLQFCHHMINYDLPWNPMQIEQRIGRIHRYGQKKDVKIYNFAIKNTIEEQIVKLLYEKIDIFEKVIGKLDDILERLQIKSIDQEMAEIFNNSSSIGEAKVKVSHFLEVIENLAENKGV